MDKRKESILRTIVKEHIKTGLPVGSEVLAQKYKFDVSSATIRNEMSELEEKGFIAQPYISAGRVPTEKAYRFYIDELDVKELGRTEINTLNNVLKNKNENNFKEAAKIISHVSGNTVFWAFHRHNLYYTGISNLFQQPEFSQIKIIYDISAIIDKMDEIVDDMFENFQDGVYTLIGSENFFSNFCSTVLAMYKLKGNIGLFGILGPMRMNYKRNIALAKYIYNKMSE